MGFSWHWNLSLNGLKNNPKKKKQVTRDVKPVPFNLEFAILFLMELLPSRAPLCFRLRSKGTKNWKIGQENRAKLYPAI